MADKYVLMVEGKDDEHVFYHLFEHHQIPDRFAVQGQEGIERLLENLPVQLKASDLERLGVVVDANTDLEARWQSICSILKHAGYHVPATPSPGGTIIQQGGKPIVGIWLMPDNMVPGMLEDFCGFLVPPSDPLWNKAEQCLQQIPEHERRFPVERWSKARVHTWLAWQEEPGKPLGQAITARYLDADAPYAQQLMNWVRQLFGL